MEVNRDNIKIIITSQGLMVIGEEESCTNNKMKLKYPFRIIPTNEGVKVAAVFLKEEWATVDLSSTIEVNVPESLKDVYSKYLNQIHGGIIMPTEEDKKIILG